MASIFLTFLIVLLMFPSQIGAATEGISIATQDGQTINLYMDYHALVVGVSEYDAWSNLPNAVKDATEVSRFLKRMGFQVTLLSNPTSQELKRTLDEFAQEIGSESDRGVVLYYAGHGETQTLGDGTKLGWIIPRDCPQLRDKPEEFAKRAMSTRDIEAYSAQLKAKHVLMLFDSSFSGAGLSLEPATLEGVSEMTALPVRQYIIAGRADEPIPDRSMFKKSFIKGLQGDADIFYDGYITGSELGVYLAEWVVKRTKEHQHPQYGKSSNPELARGDFVFLPRKVEPETGRLFVKTDPKDVRVRILNIRPRFTQGMELEPGNYHVEVSALGYTTKEIWVSVEAGEDKNVEISLSKPEEFPANSLGMKFVSIPAGSFVMGSPVEEKSRSDDENEHGVILTKGFYLQTTEVTVGQFRQFVEATGYKTQAETTGGCWVDSGGKGWKKKKGSSWRNPGAEESDNPSPTDSHPVTCVSWNDAQAFIKWLSRKEGKTYGLPTEAEWEYACRAGTTAPFAFGQCLSTDQANYTGPDPFFSDCKDAYRHSRKGPIQTGTLAANSWGLLDMHGNVSEWCQDWNGPYPSESVTDPTGPSSGTERVMRGGHWLSEAHGCRSAKRWSFPPGTASDAVGFRLVMRP